MMQRLPHPSVKLVLVRVLFAAHKQHVLHEVRHWCHTGQQTAVDQKGQTAVDPKGQTAVDPKGQTAVDQTGQRWIKKGEYGGVAQGSAWPSEGWRWRRRRWW